MNSKLLKSYIVRYDGTQEKLAEAMGISLSRLNAKINGTSGADFSQSEIAFIRMRYKLSNREVCDIFFASIVSLLDTQTAKGNNELPSNHSANQPN